MQSKCLCMYVYDRLILLRQADTNSLLLQVTLIDTRIKMTDIDTLGEDIKQMHTVYRVYSVQGVQQSFKNGFSEFCHLSLVRSVFRETGG